MAARKKNKKRPQNEKYNYDDDYDGSTPLKNDRQERYCYEYIKDFNQSQAAIRAGYKKGPAARRSAHRLMTYDYTHRRIEFLRQQLNVETMVDVPYIIKGLKAIADNEKSFEMGRIRCYELLGKYLAMFTDRKEVIQKPKRIIIKNEDDNVLEELGYIDP